MNNFAKSNSDYYVLGFIKVKNDKDTTLSIINSLFI